MMLIPQTKHILTLNYFIMQKFHLRNKLNPFYRDVKIEISMFTVLLLRLFLSVRLLLQLAIAQLYNFFKNLVL